MDEKKTKSRSIFTANGRLQLVIAVLLSRAFRSLRESSPLKNFEIVPS